MKKTILFLTCLAATAFMLTSCNGSGNEEGKSTENSETEETAAVSNEVTIGKQVWMTQNLNVDKFRNGDPIPEAKTDAEWKKAKDNKQPAWCYYNNNPDNGDRYGKLYNFYALNDPRGLAPEGWKIPFKEDWSRLIDFLGGKSVAIKKMKSTDFWAAYSDQSGNGTNESGFSGLPGGFRSEIGGFIDLGYNGYWWIYSDDYGYDPTFDVYYYIKLLSLSSSLDDDKKGYEGEGHSVRCVKSN